MKSVEMVNHRWKIDDTGRRNYVLSAHMVFTDVLFENHNVGMKAFIQKYVTRRVREGGERFIWTKLLKHGSEERCVIDQKPYGHEQPFRLIFTSKTDDTKRILVPYDI